MVNENIVTIRKIKDNFLKYWWILVTCIVVAGIVVCLNLKNKNVDQDSEYTVKTLLLLNNREAELAEEEIANAISNYNNMYDESLVSTNSINTAEMLSVLAQSNTVKTQVVSEMKKEIEAVSREHLPEVVFEAKARFVECTLKYTNIEQGVMFVNTYSDILSKEMNKIFNRQTLSVYERADVDDYQLTSSVILEDDILSTKNIFLMMLAFGLGCFIILLLALFDTKIREPFEVERMVSLKFLGRISKGKERENDLNTIKIIIQHLMETNQLSKMLIVSCGDKKPYLEVIQKINSLIVDGTAYKCDYAAPLVTHLTLLNDVKESDGIVLAISASRDSSAELEKNIITLNAMNVNILGYVLID